MEETRAAQEDQDQEDKGQFSKQFGVFDDNNRERLSVFSEEDERDLEEEEEEDDDDDDDDEEEDQSDLGGRTNSRILNPHRRVSCFFLFTVFFALALGKSKERK